MSVLVPKTPTTQCPSSPTTGAPSHSSTPGSTALPSFLTMPPALIRTSISSWASEMVSCREFEHIHISFMIAGHTKFASDQLFSTIGCAYKTEDVFTINDLKSICDKCSTCFIETGETVLTWWNSLGEKYSDLPGVRKYHNFLIVKARMEQWSWKSVRTALVEAGGTLLSVYVIHLYLECRQIPTRRHRWKPFLLKKWQTWSQCMIALYHPIPVRLLTTSFHISSFNQFSHNFLSFSISSNCSGPMSKEKAQQMLHRRVWWHWSQKSCQMGSRSTTKAGCPLQKQLA